MKKLRLLLVMIFTILLVDFSFATQEVYIATQDTNILKDAKKEAKIITTVPKGTQLTIVSPADYWYYVQCEYNGEDIEGYIWKKDTVDEVKLEELKQDRLVLTPFQEEYLKAYTYAYINEARRMNIYVYDASNLQGYYNSYNMKLSSGVKNEIAPYSNKLVNVCSTFVACMLHQALGAPLRGAEDGVPYEDTNIRGTAFSNPYGTGIDLFVEVGGDEYLQVGDVLTYANFNTHSGMYLGYDPEKDCHIVAENVGYTYLHTTKGIGPKITIDQINQTEKWAVASRLKQSVLPEDFEYPEYIEWPSQFVSGKNP